MFTCTLPTKTFSRLYAEQPSGTASSIELRRYYAVVPVRSIPKELVGWLEVNAREATDKGKVPHAIRETLTDKPEWFAAFNRGLTVVAKQVEYDNKVQTLTLKFDDKLYHGVLDGGHTLKAILDAREGLEGEEQQGYCNVEIFTGLAEEEIPAVVEARNTSKQVASKSLTNLQGMFDPLKQALGQSFTQKISWFENDDGDIDVREVIAILTALDPDFGPTPPVVAYSGKEQCLKLFRQRSDAYAKLYGIARDALMMWDAIQYYLPGQYNQKGPEPGVSGKFGRLTKVSQSPMKPKHLPFIDKSTEYFTPTGYLYPVLSAFRAMLVKEHGMWAWGKGIDPIRLIREEGAAADIFIRSVRESINNYRNPNRTGKDSQAWTSAYQAARIMYLEMETS